MAASKDQTSTILFTDVEGSTQLRTRRGDQLTDEILQAHEAIVRRQVQACGGREAAFLGDGFILTFPSALDGLHCARGGPDHVRGRRRADPGLGAGTGAWRRGGDRVHRSWPVLAQGVSRTLAAV